MSNPRYPGSGRFGIPGAGTTGAYQPPTPTSTPGTPPPQSGQTQNTTSSSQFSQFSQSQGAQSTFQTQSNTKSERTESTGTGSERITEQTISAGSIFAENWMKVRVIAEPDPAVLFQNPIIKNIVTDITNSVVSSIQEEFQRKIEELRQEFSSLFSNVSEKVDNRFTETIAALKWDESQLYTATRADSFTVLNETHQSHARTLLKEVTA